MRGRVMVGSLRLLGGGWLLRDGVPGWGGRGWVWWGWGLAGLTNITLDLDLSVGGGGGTELLEENQHAVHVGAFHQLEPVDAGVRHMGDKAWWVPCPPTSPRRGPFDPPPRGGDGGAAGRAGGVWSAFAGLGGGVDELVGVVGLGGAWGGPLAAPSWGWFPFLGFGPWWHSSARLDLDLGLGSLVVLVRGCRCR